MHRKIEREIGKKRERNKDKERQKDKHKESKRKARRGTREEDKEAELLAINKNPNLRSWGNIQQPTRRCLLL